MHTAPKKGNVQHRKRTDRYTKGPLPQRGHYPTERNHLAGPPAAAKVDQFFAAADMSNFPEECRYVLESLAEVYGYEAQAEERGLSAEERLRFHQEHSGPVMKRLHAWMLAQFAEKRVEPNSGLGSAMTYCLKHWERLTLFLRQAGAPVT